MSCQTLPEDFSIQCWDMENMSEEATSELNWFKNPPIV